MSLSEFAYSLTLRESTFEELKATTAGRAAKSDGLSFKDTQATRWWSVELDGEQVGVCGLIDIRDNVKRLKSTFIVPEWRRQGLYTMTAWLRIIEARKNGAEWVETIARKSSGAALSKVGFHGEPDRPANFYHLNVKELFSSVDLERNPIELLLELSPKVNDGT